MGGESGWARRDAGLEMEDIGCATSIGSETKEETQASLPTISARPRCGLRGDRQNAAERFRMQSLSSG